LRILCADLEISGHLQKKNGQKDLFVKKTPKDKFSENQAYAWFILVGADFFAMCPRAGQAYAKHMRVAVKRRKKTGAEGGVHMLSICELT